jgi:hypothetical protein
MLSGTIDMKYDVRPWLERFGEYDANKDGVLSLKDIALHEKLGSRLKDKHYSDRRNGETGSIYTKIIIEIRDVFLETLHLKKPEEDFSLASLEQSLRPTFSLPGLEMLSSVRLRPSQGNDNVVELDPDRDSRIDDSVRGSTVVMKGAASKRPFNSNNDVSADMEAGRDSDIYLNAERESSLDDSIRASTVFVKSPKKVSFARDSEVENPVVGSRVPFALAKNNSADAAIGTATSTARSSDTTS